MKKAGFFYLIILLISLFTLSFPLHIQAANSQTNFSISPPPIPWFEFVKGQTDLKVGANYVSISGDDLSLKGGGALTLWRYAFTNIFAFDAGGSFMFLKGTATGIDMDMQVFNSPIDLEFQIIHTNSIVLLLFGGVSFGFTGASMSLSGTDVRMVTYTYGPVAGIQASVIISDFALSPFFMFQRVSGTTEITYTYQNNTDTISEDMETYTSKTIGIDIEYKPWGITLSSMLQFLPGTGDNSGMKTYVFTLTKDFQFGVEQNSEEEQVKEEAKPELE